MEDLPFGVYRRKTTGKLYFEMRITGGKLYSTQIKSAEEGALCHDIARRYCSESLAIGGKRKAQSQDSSFNYPEYSKSLVLEDLPVEFDKERVMAIILKQAQAAATALPNPERRAAQSPRAKVQKHSGSSSQKNAYSPPKEHLDLAGDYRKNDIFQKFMKLSEHVNQCKIEYELKVIERVELERKVKDIEEDPGFISFQESGSEKFYEHMACVKQLVTSSDGKSGSPLLEAFEQQYMSEEHECCKLRKILKDHNLKSIPESLNGDGNTMTGRRKANERERLPVLEIFPAEEQNSCIMPTEVSTFCAPPTSALVLDCGENDNAMPSSTTLACEPRMESLRADSTAESDMSQPVASFEFALGDKYTDEDIQQFWSSVLETSTHTGYRREDEDERPPEQYNVEVQDHWSLFDWTDTLFSY